MLHYLMGLISMGLGNGFDARDISMSTVETGWLAWTEAFVLGWWKNEGWTLYSITKRFG